MNEIVPIESCGDPGLRGRLRQLQEENFNKALECLLTGKTPPEDFPGNKIPKRPARGGLQVDYIPGWWFIEKANAVFGHNWSYEIDEQSIGENQIWVKGRVSITIPGKTVIERFPDGREVTTHYEGYKIVKSQFGGSEIKKRKDSNAVIDIGDDLKAASTDMMKKCLTLFGFGADIYGKREILEQTGVSSSQLESLYSVGSDGGMSREEVDKYCIGKYGKLPGELEVVLILGLIGELRRKKSK